MWKTSEIRPVPKKPKVKELNDLRPVALTSTVMKCLEKIIVKHVSSCLSPFQDPLQFAYRSKRSVDDAILLFLDNIYAHIDIPRNYCRVLFVDFSSAFNTIQPHILIPKLNDLKINKHIIAWILDFLTQRVQYVQLTNVKEDKTSSQNLEKQTKSDTETSSKHIQTNTGAPQGCVLSPILFTIYTNDCRTKENNNTKLIKFADDSTLQGLINDTETHYREEIEQFVDWCDNHYLLLNVKKTKELIIDFRRDKSPIEPIVIKNENVEIASSYKYLGVNISDDLDWSNHVSVTHSKINQRLYFLRKLKYFNIDNKLLCLFYKSVIESIFTFCLICWGGNTTASDKLLIERVIKRAGKLSKAGFQNFDSLYNELCLKKIMSIVEDSSHPLRDQISFSVRLGRPLFMRCRRERYRSSLLPTAVRLLQLLKFKIEV